MSQAKDKMRRVKPLLRAREAQLNSEAQKLQRLKDMKLQALDDLKRSQNDYILTVEKINAQRQSNDRGMLLTLENSVDVVKSRFYHSLKRVRELEHQEKQQMHAVLEAERNLQSAEKLRGKYQENAKYEDEMLERKQLDEIAIRRFWGKEP